MKRKVMITTFQNAYNYGAILQCFALQDELRRLGYQIEVLNYSNKVIGNQYKPIHISNPKDSKKRFIKNLCSSIIRYPKRRQRAINFEKFIVGNMKLTRGYTKQEIKKLNWEDYALITGSDQVWNPKITRGLDDIYTLNFGNSAKKISYAASIGNVSNIENNKEGYKEIINRLESISVREEETQEELAKLVSKEIAAVLDPTLLLTKQEWDEKIKDIPQNNQKYILAYVVEPNEEYVKIVNDLSEKTGLPIVHFGVKSLGYKNVLKSAYKEGPLEFVNYIKNAEYVVTTSFHATVFSILFQKRFFVIPHKDTGARVTNLLNKIGIEGRVFYTYNEFQKMNYQESIEWTRSIENLEKERQKSIEWIKEAIEK